MLSAARDVVVCRGIRRGQPSLEVVKDSLPYNNLSASTCSCDRVMAVRTIAGAQIVCDLLHNDFGFLRV